MKPTAAPLHLPLSITRLDPAPHLLTAPCRFLQEAFIKLEFYLLFFSSTSTICMGRLVQVTHNLIDNFLQYDCCYYSAKQVVRLWTNAYIFILFYCG